MRGGRNAAFRVSTNSSVSPLPCTTQAYGFDVENENPEDAPNKMEERIAFKYAQEISQIAAELHNTES